MMGSSKRAQIVLWLLLFEVNRKSTFQLRKGTFRSELAGFAPPPFKGTFQKMAPLPPLAYIKGGLRLAYSPLFVTRNSPYRHTRRTEICSSPQGRGTRW